MKIHLAGIQGIKKWLQDGTLQPQDIFALDSFYSIQDWEIPYLDKFGSFLLDSGAFTFINSKKQATFDWNSYADRYADFIKTYRIKHYFELDIDSLIGLKATEVLRNRIEARCGVPCIPVWHLTRGKDYFESMVKDYPYVAIGGIVTKEIILRNYEKIFPWFISTAHKTNAKIHGLGYCNMKGLSQYHFDSVDSTTWIGGGNSGRFLNLRKERL